MLDYITFIMQQSIASAVSNIRDVELFIEIFKSTIAQSILIVWIDKDRRSRFSKRVASNTKVKADVMERR